MSRIISRIWGNNGPSAMFCFRTFCLAAVVPLFLLSCQTKIPQTIKWNGKDAQCSTTFVIYDNHDYQMYRWAHQDQLKLLYKGSNVTIYDDAYMEQSAYRCDKNEIINTDERLSEPFIWDLFRIQSDGTKVRGHVPDGPGPFEQYHDHLLIRTSKIKRFDTKMPTLQDFLNRRRHAASSASSTLADIRKKWQDLINSRGQTYTGTPYYPYEPYRGDDYNDIVDYNLTTSKIEAQYPFGGGMSFMFRVGKNLYVGSSGGGNLLRIDLDTKHTTDIYMMRYGFFSTTFAITSDDRAFILGHARDCGPPPLMDCDTAEAENRAILFKTNTVYEITSGKAVETLAVQYPDAVRMLAVGKELYIFTKSSQKAIKYNTETKSVVEYEFPFRYLTNINYLDKSFVLCYDPKEKEAQHFSIHCLVTDDQFVNSTKPVIVPIPPSGIATAYRNSGGGSGMGN